MLLLTIILMYQMVSISMFSIIYYWSFSFVKFSSLVFISFFFSSYPYEMSMFIHFWVVCFFYAPTSIWLILVIHLISLDRLQFQFMYRIKLILSFILLFLKKGKDRFWEKNAQQKMESSRKDYAQSERPRRKK